jgi:glycosyltransferase involved in cell wall biosynthesis
MNRTNTDDNTSISTHLVVTPARNEAENLRRLGACLIEQTWRPEAWIVVDNGSTDETPDVVHQFARTHRWIRLLSIASDAKPARGRSSVRAFNAGVLDVPKHPDLITGLDADVSFGPGYFDGLRSGFGRNPRLGMAAGLCYERSADDEGWEPVHVTYPNLRGASFTCRRECLTQLLPLEERLGWEGIAVIRANVRGWETTIFPDLSYFHHRPTGARDANRFASFAEEGDCTYYMWYRPSYILLRTVYRALGLRDPAAAGLAWGYARSALRRRSRQPEPGFREFVRSIQSPTNWLLRAREITGKA